MERYLKPQPLVPTNIFYLYPVDTFEKHNKYLSLWVMLIMTHVVVVAFIVNYLVDLALW